jgi:hypothetical protein
MYLCLGGVRMVIQEVATQLENAAWLLKTGDRVEAYRILKALVRQDPVDWRAWWGLVHAAPNPEERLTALRKTVQFNPQHAKAAELLRKAEGRLSRSAPPKPGALRPPNGIVQAHANVPDSPFVNPPFADTSTFSEPAFADQGAEDDNPFTAYEIVEAKPQTWDIEAAQTSAPVSGARQSAASSGSMDRFVNIAIVVVGLLVVVGALALVLTRLDLSGMAASTSNEPRPTSYTGGDPFRTTGGGILEIGGPSARDSVNALDEAHNWSFEGEAGQQVTIIAEAIGETDPRIRLIDPEGKVIAEDDDGGWDHGLGYWDSYLVYTLPGHGLFTIRVDIFTGGEFTLRVE